MEPIVGVVQSLNTNLKKTLHRNSTSQHSLFP